MKELAIDLLQMMSEGKTFAQVAAQFRMSEKKLMSMINDIDNEELREAYETGLTAFKAVWEEIGKDIAMGRVPNAKEATWFRLAQKHCDYQDKAIVTNEYKHSIGNDKDLMKQIDKVTKQIINCS